MQVQLKVNARTIVHAQGDTLADVFEQLAGLQEVFGHCDRCGLCGSERLRYVVRENEGYKFFECHCQSGGCKARFVFGQSKQHPGALFPQRKDKDGNVKPNQGWTRWEGNGGGHGHQEEAERPAAPAPAAAPTPPKPAGKTPRGRPA